jgi:hypothetical protein
VEKLTKQGGSNREHFPCTEMVCANIRSKKMKQTFFRTRLLNFEQLLDGSVDAHVPRRLVLLLTPAHHTPLIQRKIKADSACEISTTSIEQPLSMSFLSIKCYALHLTLPTLYMANISAVHILANLPIRYMSVVQKLQAK